MFKPKIKKSPSKLNDKSASKPKAQAAIPEASVDLTRFKGVRSSTNSTTGSKREMAEVMAAKVSKTKKATPTNQPPVILPKAKGRVTKIKPGPELKSKPSAKTIGKIAIPAARAITVSIITTVRAVCSRLIL